MFKGVPYEALKEGEWKKAVGQYLVKANHIIIHRLEGQITIIDKKVIQDIQHELVEEAKKTDQKP